MHRVWLDGNTDDKFERNVMGDIVFNFCSGWQKSEKNIEGCCFILEKKDFVRLSPQNQSISERATSHASLLLSSLLCKRKWYFVMYLRS